MKNSMRKNGRNNRKLPYYLEISYKIENENGDRVWSEWKSLAHGITDDGYEYGYVYLTPDEYPSWAEWANKFEESYGYRSRLKTDEKTLKEVKYMDEFFSM